MTSQIRQCCVCGASEFSMMGTRSDGYEVLVCQHCGTGIVDQIPSDLEALYADGYYGDVSGAAKGYTADYRLMAEHTVVWAAALSKLLKRDGAVLDIGCVEGSLLQRLGTGYERFGIEANARMSTAAAAAGIQVIGTDLLAPDILEDFAGRFDLVTAIAVFEHLPDLRKGFDAAIQLLKQDGILLFEVPLISETNENSVWYNTSLEHVFYPTERGLRFLVEQELGYVLIGRELFIREYGSTYMGIVCKSHADHVRVSALFKRLTGASAAPTSDEEWAVRSQINLVHAANSEPALVERLNLLPFEQGGAALVYRLGQIWQIDLRHLGLKPSMPQGPLPTLAWQVKYDLVSAQKERLEAELALHQVREEGRIAQVNRLTAADEVRQTRFTELQAELHAATADLASERSLSASLNANLSHLRDELSDKCMCLEGALKAHDHVQRLVQSLVARDRNSRAERKRLRNDMATASHDRNLNAGQMIQAMIAAEQRVSDAEKAASRYLKESADVAERFAKVSEEMQAAKARLPLARLRRFLGRASSFASPQEDPANPARDPEAATTDAGLIPVLLPAETLPPGPDSGEADPWPEGRPLVSIVIPCFNYGHFVGEAVAAALAQTFTNLEVIVVEGGSTSMDSRAALANLQHPGVRILLQPGPHRAGANRNFGISQARGKYICCLDADDKIHPTYIEKAVFLLEHYHYDVVSTAMRFFDQRDDMIGVMERPVLADMLEGNHIMTCGVFRRSMWRRAGGFRDSDREKSGYIYEDWMFWIRVGALGARYWNIAGEPLFFYRRHGVSLSTRDDVVPEDKQRAIMAALNADVLSPDALRRSREKADQVRVDANPLRNLEFGSKPAGTKTTILLALPFTILGGAERLLSGIVRHLVASGWRVIIVTTVPVGLEHGDTTDWFSASTPEIYHLPRFLAKSRWDDFVHYLLNTRAISLLWIVGSAFFYDRLEDIRAKHPSIAVVDLLFNTVGHTFNNRMHAHSIDLNIVENKEVLNWLIAHGEIRSRIRVIESGVDLEDLVPGGRSVKLVETLGIASETLLVGFSGRWSEEKDPLGFIEIARLVPADVPVVFLMTGTGPLHERVTEAMSAAGLTSDRFHLLGPVDHLKPVLQSYDLLCLPSRLDGRPVVVLEALALGVPVLASRVGALPELIEDGVNGYLCDPQNYQAFVERIVSLARDRKSLSTLRAAAREFATKRLDAKQMNGHYEASLHHVLAERATAPSLQ